ncbi:OLC1v1025129C1 [Oldenlandia corymbosa var. corymbosa]|uniref:Germin-like protein n=1 Tax=Oldenlandia corymbosa var. corymbosa TaxID=529605 RepID=A0AAV1C4W3_OLDCO|nr:OLC1v1025129C1 [Oldenlandia corymbosa var. corymbosa]
MAYQINLSLILVLTIVSVCLPWPSLSVDPTPLQDFCIADLESKSPIINGFPCKKPADASSKDFFFEGLTKRGNEFDTLNVNLTQVDVFAFPALNTLGMSMNRVEFLPGGLNPPHTHPRATELSLVVEGKLLAGWVSTEYILYWKVVSAGELFVIPPGMVHFQLNVGEGRAQFYASFNSQNPGISKMAPTLFDSIPLIPDDVLSTAFNLNDSVIQLIKSKVAHLGR